MTNIKENFEDMYYYLYRLIRRIKEWILYRTIDRYHIVNSGLPPGYYDKDELLINVCFNLLKDYVECECATMWLYTNPELRKMNWKYRLRRWKKFRDPEHGLAYLTWETTLKGKFCKNQRESAREILDLYNWWMNVRPLRIDPFDDYPAYYDSSCLKSEKVIEEDGSVSYKLGELPEEAKEKIRAHHKWAGNILEAQDKEDTKMLCRLMKVRKSLWT